MNTKRRIAVNAGGGYVPGMNAVAAGVARAAHHLGWECVGIRDGYEGVLFPDRYPGGGVVPLTPAAVDGLADAPAPLLGTSRVDPERVRTVTDEVVTEPDRSADVLVALKRERIDAVVSVVDRRAMGIAWKLQKKGLPTVCVPESVENDLAVTELSFGFNTAVSFTVELLDRVRQAARSTHRVAVVEVLGQFAGWLALHAGTAALADAVLIPEIHYDLGKVAARLTAGGPRPALVVVAEGARGRGRKHSSPLSRASRGRRRESAAGALARFRGRQPSPGDRAGRGGRRIGRGRTAPPHHARHIPGRPRTTPPRRPTHGHRQAARAGLRGGGRRRAPRRTDRGRRRLPPAEAGLRPTR